MAGSLRDQLIKSGLVTADQARKAERQARAEERSRKPSKKAPAAGTDSTPATGPAAEASPVAAIKARARAQNAEKAARDRALQQAVNEKAAARALRAELKQLIQQNDQRAKTASEDDVPYNFLHGKRIKRIYITRAQQAQLSSGSLNIVNDDGRYHLVSNEVAARIQARDPKRIITSHGANASAVATAEPGAAPEPGSDEEFYARFQVPEDLDW